jgi:hypothetical protein
LRRNLPRKENLFDANKGQSLENRRKQKLAKTCSYLIGDHKEPKLLIRGFYVQTAKITDKWGSNIGVYPCARSSSFKPASQTKQRETMVLLATITCPKA